MFVFEEKEESWSSQSKNQDLESPAIDKELKEEVWFICLLVCLMNLRQNLVILVVLML